MFNSNNNNSRYVTQMFQERNTVKDHDNNRLDFNHSENLPIKYTEYFVCKNENFIRKKNDIFIIFAQNIDCGYKFEPPRPRRF